jgi:hypothetical protein
MITQIITGTVPPVNKTQQAIIKIIIEGIAKIIVCCFDSKGHWLLQALASFLFCMSFFMFVALSIQPSVVGKSSSAGNVSNGPDLLGFMQPGFL